MVRTLLFQGRDAGFDSRRGYKDIMFEYGQLVKLKNDLIIGKRYDNLVYTKHHAKFFGKLLNIYKVSSNGTYYCAEGDIKHSVTFSQAMLEVPNFNMVDTDIILKNFILNANQLQRKDAYISREESVYGSGVHGRLRKVTIQSRRIRDPKAIKGI